MLGFGTDGPYLTRGNRDMIPPKLYAYKSLTQVAGAYRSCLNSQSHASSFNFSVPQVKIDFMECSAYECYEVRTPACLSCCEERSLISAQMSRRANGSTVVY